MKFKLMPVAVFVALLLMVLAATVLAQEEAEVPPPYAGLETPFSWDDASAQEAGEVIYRRYCETCHGPDRGDEDPEGPSFSTSDYPQKLEESPDFYFWIVSEGRLDTEMLSWGSRLSEEERWQALTYIWSLGGEVPLTIPPLYTGLENPFSWDDASAQEAGKVIYQRYCEVCHGPNRIEELGSYGPSFSTSEYPQKLEESPDLYFWTVSEGRLDTPMPPWGSAISEEERWQVLTYIWSLGGAVTAPTATLTITVNGSGFAAPAMGEHEYSADEAVTITATPDSGWQFDGWDGDVANSNSATTTVTMDASKTVTANFSETPVTTTPPPATTVPNPDEETPLNMWLIIGSVLGILVVGGVVYYFVRSGR